MTKKRIYDLAKEYSMDGKELAAKLRDMGFTQVKSHMTALDDFEALEVQAKLEAHGIIPESSKDSPREDLGGGLIVRRKKKRQPSETQGPLNVAVPEMQDSVSTTLDLSQEESSTTLPGTPPDATRHPPNPTNDGVDRSMNAGLPGSEWVKAQHDFAESIWLQRLPKPIADHLGQIVAAIIGAIGVIVAAAIGRPG